MKECKCGNPLIVKQNIYYYDSRWFSGLFCQRCEHYYDNPKDSMMQAYVKSPEEAEAFRDYLAGKFTKNMCVQDKTYGCTREWIKYNYRDKATHPPKNKKIMILLGSRDDPAYFIVQFNGDEFELENGAIFPDYHYDIEFWADCLPVLPNYKQWRQYEGE